jgi:hypothetical protein
MNLGLTADQLEARRKYLCAGDAQLILDGRWNLLWRIKKGLEQEADFYDGLQWYIKRNVSREQMDLRRLMGQYTEPLNLAYCQERTGRPVTYYSGNPMLRAVWKGLQAVTYPCKDELQVSKDYPFMGAHLDAMTTTAQGEPMVLDAKDIARASDDMIQLYTPAGTHQAVVMGVDWWGLSIFAGKKWELVEQPVDPLFRARLIAAEREFYGYLERDAEPADQNPRAEAPKPRPRLRQILLDQTPMDERPNWSGEFMRLARQFAETKGASDLHAITRKAMTELVPDDVGLCAVGLVRFKRDGRGVTIAMEKTDDC